MAIDVLRIAVVVDYRLEGDVSLTSATGPVPPGASGPAIVEIVFPESAPIAVAHLLSVKWELLGKVTFTR